MKQLKGRVIKAVASKYKVDTEEGTKNCFARKKLKLIGDIFVGDYVLIEEQRKEWTIEKILPRKNCLIRPYVSNVDICLIVIAVEPEPDFLLVDKIIINCLKENIEPILIANKSDIKSLDLAAYQDVLKTIICSAETKHGLDELKGIIKNKTVCFAGQSAVGKSSILNALLESDVMEVGGLSKKVNRGKNTTRHTEIFKLIDLNTYLIDTCGFSMLDSIEIEPEDLRFYYDDFEKFRVNCKFNSCTHIDEPECSVKEHVGKEIDKGRYERYKIIYNELIDRRKNKYD